MVLFMVGQHIHFMCIASEYNNVTSNRLIKRNDQLEEVVLTNSLIPCFVVI